MLDLLTRDDLALAGILTSLVVFLAERIFKPSRLIDKALVQLSLTFIIFIISLLRKRYKSHHAHSHLLNGAHGELHTLSQVIKGGRAIG